MWMKKCLPALMIIGLLFACKESNKHVKHENTIKHIASDSFYLTGFYLTTEVTDGYNVRQIEIETDSEHKRHPEFDSTYFFINPAPIIASTHFKTVNIIKNEFDQPSLEIKLDEEGEKKFGEASGKAIGKYIAFIIDNKLISTAIVKEKITDGLINIPMRGYPRSKLEEFKEIIENEK